MKITVEGNVFEGTPEEIKEMMTLLGAEFPESAKPKAEEKESETKPKTEKRKARVGERILITKAEAPSGQYKNGDILTVSKAFGKLGSPHAIQADGVDIGIYHNEYEVIVENKTKFKVGDRARIKTTTGALAGFTAGEVVEIRALGRESVNDVEVYGKSHGITGYTTSENLEELTNEFREGDRVKALADGEFSDVNEGEIGTIVDFIEDDVDSYNIEVKTADDYDYFRPQDLELITEETTKLEDGDYVVALPGAPYYITSSDMKLGKIVGNGLLAGDDIIVKVIAHDDAFRVGNEYSVESKYFRKATDEEIAKFIKKPRGFKKGDIVRFNEDTGSKYYPEGSFAEITSEVIGSNFSFGDGYAGDTEWVELVAPVESRVDVR